MNRCWFSPLGLRPPWIFKQVEQNNFALLNVALCQFAYLVQDECLSSVKERLRMVKDRDFILPEGKVDRSCEGRCWEQFTHRNVPHKPTS